MRSKEAALSIIVPTRNRSSYLERLLSYYADCRSPFPILIGDSSHEEEQRKTARMVQFFSRTLRVSHRIFPVGSGMYPVSYDLVKAVFTPYIVLLADDDLLVPRGLEAAVDFLETHPDYSAAHGMAALIKLSSPGPYGTVEWSESYGPSSIEHKQPGERLAAQFKTYNTAFSVHRKRIMEIGYQHVVDLGLEAKFAELLTQSLNVIFGKTKRLNLLYLVRQTHPGQDSVQAAKTRDIFEWLLDPEWRGHYEGFLNCLISELSIQQQIQPEEAQKALEKIFWFYLTHGLKKSWKARYASGERSRFSELFERRKNLRKIWHHIRAFIPWMEPEMSLPALLRPSSRFSQDFMPIYKVVSAFRDGEMELVSSAAGADADAVST